jgi:hypothetical protein
MTATTVTGSTLKKVHLKQKAHAVGEQADRDLWVVPLDRLQAPGDLTIVRILSYKIKCIKLNSLHPVPSAAATRVAYAFR